MTTPLLRKTIAVLALGLAAAPAMAQPAPPPATGSAAGAPNDGRMMRDPFGDATITRQEAEAQATARFTALDTDKDGYLSPAELAAARPGRPQGEGPRGGGQRRGGMARMLDANGDGKISRDEFIAGSLRRFDMMDTDHDGKLTKAERQAAMEAMRARMEERMRERFQSGEGGGMGGAMSGGGD